MKPTTFIAVFSSRSIERLTVRPVQVELYHNDFSMFTLIVLTIAWVLVSVVSQQELSADNSFSSCSMVVTRRLMTCWGTANCISSSSSSTSNGCGVRRGAPVVKMSQPRHRWVTATHMRWSCARPNNTLQRFTVGLTIWIARGDRRRIRRYGRSTTAD